MDNNTESLSYKWIRPAALSERAYCSVMYSTRDIQKVSYVCKHCRGIDTGTLLSMRGKFVDSLARQQRHL